MELDIWKGDWGLPSIDIYCLQIMTCAKFSGAPLKIKRTNNPWKSPSGLLPVLHHGDKVLTGFKEIYMHLQENNYNADFDLNMQLHSEIEAYTHMLQDKLLPALNYIFWVDSKNYIDFTRPWYAKALPFPLNFFIPGQYERKAKRQLLTMFDLGSENEQLLETLVFRRAQECFNLLSVRLGDEDFFMGKKPCSLDAIIFAYLAILFKVPFPNSSLSNHLKSYENLTRFVVRVLHRYFPPTQAEVTHSSSNSATDEEFPNKRWNQFLSGFFALVAMTGYAFMSGLVQVEISTDTDAVEQDVDGSEFPHYFESTYGDSQEE